jgi:CRP/FNR family cyclic AMP-dependent transcriptional regulator
MSEQSSQDWVNIQIFQQLRRAAWFGNLPHSIASALFEVGSCVEYTAGQLIYLQDSPNQGLFGVIDGTVHFETIEDTGRRIFLDVAGPGHWFGDIAAPSDARTLFTAQAFRRVKAWRIPFFALRRLMGDMPELCRACSQLMAMRVAVLTERVCVMHKPNALVQVAGALALLHRNLSENAPPPHGTLIYMTQSDLADMTGLSRQTTNMIMGQLEQMGMIRARHRLIEIRDAARLSAYCLCGSNKVHEVH